MKFFFSYLSSHLISPFSHLTSSHPSLIFDLEKFHLSCTLTRMCFPQLGCNSNEIFLLSSLISPHRRSSEEEELLTNHLSSQSVMEEKESQWDVVYSRMLWYVWGFSQSPNEEDYWWYDLNVRRPESFLSSMATGLLICHDADYKTRHGTLGERDVIDELRSEMKSKIIIYWGCRMNGGCMMLN